ncbi:antiviral helicase [Anaeromyces robustus]|uniref:Antiviral helicase n=1 Tax=Anaeromyces robustus TaxID=1754192 RepID=A0A1Y1XAH1_9FUNG|nr:antiviral helicase [Anaeromyces robustus]|eukprot:ORX82713.1 antiviral helicase [Anaeromyces robustus]
MDLNEKHKKWAHKVDITDSFPEFYDLIPEMAHEFPFELDVFQKQAIFHLENGDSVFIAAHTSAGKTVVADYAIALAQKHMTRAIYTSPIKALSNQKFRDFHNTFEDIGIITGDVKINQNASCLIMTTEILRSMLYKGADIIRDVEFVIFDEVHYINDSERGVVWEEVIIMLPEHVKLILLSATVPNTMEFAEWIGRTKKKNIYVISTLKRPVPLEHYLFVKNNIYKIVDAQQNFLKNNYDAANEALTGEPKDKNAKGSSNNKKTNNKNTKQVVKSKKPVSKIQTTRNMYNHMVGFLAKSELLPVVIFTFSKKKCEEYADGLINKDLLNDANKRSAIYSFISNSLSRLKGSDRELPQINRMKELLSRGIGVHHSGLLPIMKEVVEILFSKGLVKVLFATETFAMGVNMPARAVVFSELRKHDGQKFRDLLSNEYIQMSGRAGRRGLDDTGVVIIATLDKLPEIQTINNVVLGKSQKLESQFRLTYNMILNLLRVETLRVEEMIKRSFSENVTQAALPEQQQEYEKNNEILKNMEDLTCVICKIDINLYYNYTEEILNLNKQIHKKIIASSNNQRIFCPGRILIINNEKFNRTIAVILKVSTKIHNNVIMNSEEDKKLIHCLIVHENINSEEQISKVNGKLPITEINNIKSSIQPLTYIDIELITSTIIKIDQDSILNHNESVISSVQQELIRIAKSFNDSNEIEECSWKKLKDIEFQEYYKRKNVLLERIKALKCNNCPDFVDHYNIVSEKKKIEYKINELFKNLSENNLQLLPDYNQRIEVLKFLRYIDDNLTVQLKGKIACEISTADELLLTELVLDNFFAEFDLAESAALLSCFIFQEKSQNEPALTSNLEKGIAKIKDMALNLADIQRSFNIDISTQDYVATVNIGLVEVVYEWAKGVPFKQITELTDVLEGSIVRCIVRLDEVCRQVKNASRIIGDSSLYIKMEKTSELIKRDIVFAQSLYF